MTTCFLAPDPIQSTFLIPGGNTVGNGVQIFCYTAGSTTKSTVYKDNAAAASWTNPIVLDSGGNLPSGGSVWIPTGVTMKFVYAPSNDTDPPASPYRTLDNISGVNDVGGAAAQSQWVAGPTPTFVSGTSFTLVGDQTATFHAGRRLQSTNTAGTIYSTILTSVFTSLTTVTVANDSGALDSGLSAVNYGLISAVNTSDPNIFGKGVSGLGYNIAARTNSVNTSSQIDISADTLQVVNSSTGATLILSSIAFTADITTTGINGLDTGSESTNTWYYGYIISNAQASSGALLSIQSSAPTLPAGYTYKALVTAVRNNNLGDFPVYVQKGAIAWYSAAQTFIVNATNTSEAHQTTPFIWVPPISEQWIASVGLTGSANSSGIISVAGNVGWLSGVTVYQLVLNMQGLVASSTVHNENSQVTFPYTSNGIYYSVANATGSSATLSVSVSGFKLPGGGQ